MVIEQVSSSKEAEEILIQNDKINSFLTFSFPVKVISLHHGKGRGLFATKDIQKGKQILTDNPVVATTTTTTNNITTKLNHPYQPSPSYSHSNNLYCNHCFLQQDAHHLKQCSDCKLVYYCSRDCQRKGWISSHKLECKNFALFPKHLLNNELFWLLFKLLILAQIDPERFRLMDHLVSNRTKFNSTELEEFRFIVNEIDSKKIFSSLNLISDDQIELLCKLKCNSFSICDAEYVNSGTAIYPYLSLANHDCQPNTVICFEGPTATLRTIRPIRKGEEILISYVESRHQTGFRQHKFKTQFFFECQCQLCKSDSYNQNDQSDIETTDKINHDNQAAYYCPNKYTNSFCSGKFYWPDLKSWPGRNLTCSGCEQNWDGDKIPREYIVTKEKALLFVRAMTNSHQRVSVQKLMDFEKELGHIACSSNELYYTLITKLQDELLCQDNKNEKDWKLILEIAEKRLSSLQSIYSTKQNYHHPILSIQYHLLAKLCIFLNNQNTKKTEFYFTQSQLHLQVTHGVQNKFYKESSEWLDQFQMERRMDSL